jgi:hypothetical protein
LLDWDLNGNVCYGIIDCNIHENRNPLLDELKFRKIKKLDFVILSHLHYDHYSGLSELFEFCLLQKIPIDLFLHTFENSYLKILDWMVMSQKEMKTTDTFFQAIDNCVKGNLFGYFDSVTKNSREIHLTPNITLKFLGPEGADNFTLAREISNYENERTTTIPDMNRVSTIIEITNGKECVLLTSDALKKPFRTLTQVINKKVLLCQVPHHGSANNLYERFWGKLDKTENCPSVFSVGEVKKDKLPNIEVVTFFHETGFRNYSTNKVYGIKEFYDPCGVGERHETEDMSRAVMSAFSRSLIPSPSTTLTNARFSGDKSFSFFV